MFLAEAVVGRKEGFSARSQRTISVILCDQVWQELQKVVIEPW